MRKSKEKLVSIHIHVILFIYYKQTTQKNINRYESSFRFIYTVGEICQLLHDT